MLSPARILLITVVAAFALGCGASAPPPEPTLGPDDPAVAITISPLQLDLVADTVWDLEVKNGAQQVVWQRRVTSSTYGDGLGAVSYVGPCDASVTEGDDRNTVTIRLIGAYTGSVSPLASDEAGYSDPRPAGAIELQDPGAMSKRFECVDNGDVRVDFDVTVLRPAQQGFFDVAVNFNNIYCSAKFDCEKPGGDPIELLFDGDTRGRTNILGFSCAGGTTDAANTRLYLEDLVIDCGADNTITIDPLAADGNYYRAGAWTGVTTSGAPPSLFQVAVYKGVEQLPGIDKRYWNIALGVGPAAGWAGCRLRTTGTADDNGRVVRDNVVEAGVVYPFIHWDVALDSCGIHPVGDDDEVVAIHYTASSLDGDADDSPYGDYAFDHVYGDFCDDCTLPSGAPNIDSGCTNDHQCWTNTCVAGTCVNPATIACSFDPPNLPADGETEATLTCTIEDAAPGMVFETLYVDLSEFGGSAQTALIQQDATTWQLGGIIVPETVEPGVYEADVVTTTPHNRAWAPLQVIIPEQVDADTHIYIYFDSSGSMNSTLSPLNTMKNGVLKDALLKYYGGDATLYNQRVTITSIGAERTFQWMHRDGAPGDRGRAIVLIFQDEANSDYHASGNVEPSTRTGEFETDFTALRAKLLETDPTKQQWSLLRVGVAAVENSGNLTFQNFMRQVFGGTDAHADPEWNLAAWNVELNGDVPPATGVNALMTLELNVTDGEAASYYFGIVQDLAERLQIFIPDP